MKKQLFLVFSLFMLSYFISSAQENCEIKFSGHIIDQHDGTRLSYASIFIIENARGVAADEVGSFAIHHLCPGLYTVVISHLGCESDTQKIDLMANLKRDFFLEHHTELLNEVKVEAKSQVSKTAGFAQIDEKEREENMGENLAQTLESINGVRTLTTGSNISKPVIGGFSANRVQMINSGVQHASQLWGNEHAPEIDPNEEATYSVIKGASSVRYSDGAIGGIVIVEPKPLALNPGVSGSIRSMYASNNRMNNTALSLGGSFTKLRQLSWRAQASFKKAGDIKSPDYYQQNTGVEERNFSWQLAYRAKKFKVDISYKQFNAEIGILTAAHIGNLTDLRNAIERGVPSDNNRGDFSYEIQRPKQIIIHELVKGDVNYYVNDKNKLRLILARQFNIREEFDKEIARSSRKKGLDIPEFSLNLETYSSELLWENNSNSKLNSVIGIQFMAQDNTLNSFTDFIPEYKSNRISFYLSETLELGKFEGTFGIRMSSIDSEVNKLEQREYKTSDLSFKPLTIHMGISRLLFANIQFKSSLFWAERSPGINELFSDGLHHGAASIETGDVNLGKETARGLSLELLRKGEKTSFQVYTKWQRIEDFIYLVPQGIELTIRGAYPAYNWQNTNAELIHLDYSMSRTLLPSLMLKHQGSLLWAKQLDNNQYLNFMPANRMDLRLDYSFKIFNQREKSTSLSLIGEHVFQQNRINLEEEISDVPAAYELVHINLQQEIGIRENNLTLQFRINNLLNKSYRDYLNRFRFFTDEQGRDFRIAIQYKF